MQIFYKNYVFQYNSLKPLIFIITHKIQNTYPYILYILCCTYSVHHPKFNNPNKQIKFIINKILYIHNITFLIHGNTR